MKSFNAAVLVAFLALTTGCSGATRNSVVMELVAFEPQTLSVDPGSEVKWMQSDPGFHTVTSGRVAVAGANVKAVPSGDFDSGRLARGETFEFTFREPGRFAYFCSIHAATMRGVVEVG